MQITANIIDGAVIGLLLISGLMAWARGLTRELAALFGWVLAGAGAVVLTPYILPYVTRIPIIGDMLARQCALAVLAAFSVGVVILLVVIGLLSRILSNAVSASAIGGLDKALGFLFGVARGVVIIAVMAWGAKALLPGFEEADAFQQARTKGLILDSGAALAGYMPGDLPNWASGRLDRLMSHCAGSAPPPAAPAPAPTGA